MVYENNRKANGGGAGGGGDGGAGSGGGDNITDDDNDDASSTHPKKCVTFLLTCGSLFLKLFQEKHYQEFLQPEKIIQ